MAIQKTLHTEAIKWGVAVLGALVVAGAVSLANRDVYSKEQVDEKFMTSDRIQEIQNKHTNEQLGLIRGDITEIKELVRESK